MTAPVERTSKTVIYAVLVAAASLVTLYFHARRFMPFIADDALISLRYAQRFLEGHGMTWTEGRPVEGYSNLLWILLVALLGFFRVDLIEAARFLGYGCHALMLAAFLWRYPPTGFRNSLPALAGTFTLVLAGPVAVWTIGGLEQPLFCVLLAWSMVFALAVLDQGAAANRYIWPASFLLGLLCITRPDGALFPATMACGIVALHGFTKRAFVAACKLVLFPIIFVMGQLAFRLAYYGEFVPNTALVKVSPSLTHLKEGRDYIWEGFLALGPVSEIAVLVFVISLFPFLGISKARRKAMAFLFIPALLWAAYVAFVSGDIFPAWRHYTPILVLMAFLVAESLAGFLRWSTRGWATALALIMIPAALAPFHYYQRQDKENLRAIGERWEWKGQVIGLMLKKGFGDKEPLLAVTAAGCLPYWSELPCLDMLGLNDYYLPRHPPKNRHKRSTAHGLGDGDYVLRQNPDLIIYGTGHLKATYLSGRQMERRKEYRERYTPMVFEGREPTRERAVIWVNRLSRKIGIRKTANTIIVPAMFMNGGKNALTYLDEDGSFVVSATREVPAVLRDLAVPPGKWTLEASASEPAIGEVRVRGRGGLILAGGRLPLPLNVPGNRLLRLDISIWPESSQNADVKELTLRRLDD